MPWSRFVCRSREITGDLPMSWQRIACTLLVAVTALTGASGAQAPVTQAGASAPQGGRGPRPARPASPRKRVLAWADTRNGVGQHEFVSHALAVIERLGYDSGTYDTYIRTDSHIVAAQPKKTTGEPASGGPSLSNVDAIFFMGHRDVPIDDAQKAELLAFVRDQGKGFVAAHHALTAFDSWPEFGELLGARYDGHPWGTASGTIVNEGTDFPATRHLAPTFAFSDEFYQPKAFSRDKMRVLLRLDVGKMPASAGVHVKGDLPLAWAKPYGKGRVFYSALGHEASTWDNRDVAQMYFEAIKWALGLTEGDIASRALPPTP
jgi:uncharacterized protein